MCIKDKEMRNRKYDKEFKLDCIKYCAEHPELSQTEAVRNLGVPEQTLNRWLINSQKQGEDTFRGSGNFASDKNKEIARLQRELRNANDAISILKKAIGILGEK